MADWPPPDITNFSSIDVATAVYVSGTQVLTTQQGALANDAPATVCNQILVVLRDHGLIAS